MTRILHLDASPRPGRAGTHAHGSHSRRLTHHFVTRWRAARPDDEVIYRDIGVAPPRPVSAQWIHAAFTPAERRTPEMRQVLAESDVLIAELVAADVLVLGVPLYNFGMPAGFKAWIDNVIRIGDTFGFDPARGDEAYIPLLADRTRHAVLLSSRGGNGFEPGGPMAHMNHLEPHLRTVLEFVGITDLRNAAIEHEEEGGEHLAASTRTALARMDELVDDLLEETVEQPESAPA